mmetsp:Transcript_35148/g.80167  ORF Transcript_35148/g.80167 Transcript_35148/m.80167 type:complete len:337 (-) Transcript_35148:226-1236(-)|eukprot:CAMPEP_0114561494 /NCGR_PEP_ID=MMETSP0114-20121206/12033_1 /TAXON_ID=31324 /ORGANISM="Goniomonas sp, Strain m" /LENGTH=336 /DNA_ID=CAMNT_0001747131 /DNA_START=184 /DNA_END=1194 /DNA_ORIENTATION=-
MERGQVELRAWSGWSPGGGHKYHDSRTEDPSPVNNQGDMSMTNGVLHRMKPMDGQGPPWSPNPRQIQRPLGGPGVNSPTSPAVDDKVDRAKLLIPSQPSLPKSVQTKVRAPHTVRQGASVHRTPPHIQLQKGPIGRNNQFAVKPGVRPGVSPEKPGIWKAPPAFPVGPAAPKPQSAPVAPVATCKTPIKASDAQIRQRRNFLQKLRNGTAGNPEEGGASQEDAGDEVANGVNGSPAQADAENAEESTSSVANDPAWNAQFRQLFVEMGGENLTEDEAEDGEGLTLEEVEAFKREHGNTPKTAKLGANLLRVSRDLGTPDFADSGAALTDSDSEDSG